MTDKLDNFLLELEYDDEDIQSIYTSFNEKFHTTIDKLIYIGESIDASQISFYLDSDIVIYFGDYEEWCKLVWFELEGEKIIFHGDNPLWYDVCYSDCKKKMILYPFEQGKEVSLRNLGFSKNVVYLGEIYDDRFTYGDYTIMIAGNGDSYTLLQKIDDNDQMLISKFDSNCTSFQLGDGSTTVYLHNDTDLIVSNDGDVSSIVVFLNVI